MFDHFFNYWFLYYYIVGLIFTTSVLGWKWKSFKDSIPKRDIELYVVFLLVIIPFIWPIIILVQLFDFVKDLNPKNREVDE